MKGGTRTKITFLDFLECKKEKEEEKEEEYKVVIPVIQRDYAHGRDHPRAREVRERFVKEMWKHLGESRPYHMDFIFGLWENSRFILIDGQQRMTFLFLFHLYLSARSGKLIEILDCLQRFHYEVRESTRAFVEAILENANCLQNFPGKSPGSLFRFIQDQPWFLPHWMRDPTVKSMLMVLDEIHHRCPLPDDPESAKDVWTAAWRWACKEVTFDVLDLGTFNLEAFHEDLYIRMNARGLALTPFEVFKGRLFRYLHEKHDLDLTVIRQWATKMDGEWLDFFWQNYSVGGQGTRVEQADQSFLNFSRFVLEMLAWKNRGMAASDSSTSSEGLQDPEDLSDDVLLEQALISEEDIFFFFFCFDRLTEILQGSINKKGQAQGHISVDADPLNLVLFWGRETSEGFQRLRDGLDRLIRISHNQRESMATRILLFSFFRMAYQALPDREIQQRLRIIRNLLEGTRHLYLAESSPPLPSDRRRHVPTLIYVLDTFLNKNEPIDSQTLRNLRDSGTGILQKVWNHEIEKLELRQRQPDIEKDLSSLEDHIYLRGNLRSLMERNSLLISFDEFASVFGSNEDIYHRSRSGVDLDHKRGEREEFSHPGSRDPLIIATLLTLQARMNKAQGKGFTYPLSDSGGSRRFFGRVKYWQYLFASDRMEPLWKCFFRKIKEELQSRSLEHKHIEKILQSIVANDTERRVDSWLYYYSRYCEIFEDFLGDDFLKKYGDSGSSIHPFFTRRGKDVNIFVGPVDQPFLWEKNRTIGKTSEHVHPLLFAVWTRLRGSLDGYEVTLSPGIGKYRKENYLHASHATVLRIQPCGRSGSLLQVRMDPEKIPAWRIELGDTGPVDLARRFLLECHREHVKPVDAARVFRLYCCHNDLIEDLVCLIWDLIQHLSSRTKTDTGCP